MPGGVLPGVDIRAENSISHHQQMRPGKLTVAFEAAAKNFSLYV
jgi:hypothetical protein